MDMYILYNQQYVMGVSEYGIPYFFDNSFDSKKYDQRKSGFSDTQHV